jgi:hypothetical protein
VGYSAGVALGPDEASKGGRGGATGHDGLRWLVAAFGGDGVYVGPGHVAAVAGGIHDFV